MSAPSRLHLDRTTEPGHVLLRAASAINDLGAGPLEIRARRGRSGRWTLYQAIYGSGESGHGRGQSGKGIGRRRRARRGVRLFETKAKLIFKYVPGERYGFPTIGAFSYWKFAHAAGFQLWSVDSQRHAVNLVRRGPKVDYCLRDLIRSHPSRSSPRDAVYPACNQDPHLRRDVLGTSVGWADVYPYEYPQQWIDVTGLKGVFAYVQVADPDNLLIESNHKNDVSETYVALPSGRVLGHRVGVAAP
jgi:hypothetical protein